MSAEIDELMDFDDGFSDLLDLDDPATLQSSDADARLHELSERWAALKDVEDRIDGKLKRVKELRASVESALFAAMTDARLPKFKAEGIGTISQRRDTYAKVVDSELAMAWLVANDYEEIIRTQVDASRLRSVVKDREKNGEELPEGVDFWVKESVSLRRT